MYLLFSPFNLLEKMFTFQIYKEFHYYFSEQCGLCFIHVIGLSLITEVRLSFVLRNSLTLLRTLSNPRHFHFSNSSAGQTIHPITAPVRKKC